MTRRSVISVGMVVVGLFLMTMSYFAWAAPWGFPPSSDTYSNPRVPFAPGIFVLGVMIAFLAAIVYELLPEEAIEGA